MMKEESDTQQPEGHYAEAIIETKERPSQTSDVSSTTYQDRNVVVHDATVEKVEVTFNVNREAEQRANLIANRGPEREQSSIAEEE
jgi:hypothetical protein